MSIYVSELNIYPVKSCRGFGVASAIVTKRGFTYDRAWMIVDDKNKCITQREKPLMALIQPQLLDSHTKLHLLDQSTESATIALRQEKHTSKTAAGCIDKRMAKPLELTSEQLEQSTDMAKSTIMQHCHEQVVLNFTAPNMPPIAVQPNAQGTPRIVTVWNDTCEAIDEGDEIAEWLSTYIKISCRLVRMADTFVRSVDAEYADTEDQVGFADAYPFLLISTASLEDLNSKLDQALPMNRFRPNIVVSGCASFAEDTWRQARIGPCELNVVKPCDRCVVTTTDQETGKRGQEPLRTLAKYRNKDNKVLFGQNLIPKTTGLVEVGDQVEVLTYN
jgi:uncharacterized protein